MNAVDNHRHIHTHLTHNRQHFQGKNSKGERPLVMLMGHLRGRTKGQAEALHAAGTEAR